MPTEFQNATVMGQNGSDAKAVLRGADSISFRTPPCGGWRNACQVLNIACLSNGNGRPRTCKPIPPASIRGLGNNREGTPSFILPETRLGARRDSSFPVLLQTT